MLAVRIDAHGGPEVLTPVECEPPEPGPGEVLVGNTFVGVNFVDLQHRRGHPYPVTLPLIPGTEAAGTVAAVGPGGDPGSIGHPVVHFGHLAGCYAEFTAVPTDFVVPLEPGTPLDIAAAVAISGTTAHVLTRTLAETPDQWVAVHAAAGATGGAVVQLAVAAGARVVALASTTAKAEQALVLGARHAVTTGGTPDVAAAVRELTGGRGADVVYDAGGRDTFEASLAMLATRGTLVLYGAATGDVPPFQLARLSGLTAGSGAGSLTVSWLSASDFLRGADRGLAMRAVLAEVDAGRLNPRIHERFALREAAAAHQLLASRTVTGKLLLAV